MNKFTEEFKEHISRIVQTFKKEIAGVRQNRPTPALLEDLRVNYYDQQLTIKQLGSLSIQPPREIDIHVWEKGALAAILKAIEASNLGLSANSEGNVIRVFLPELSKERRGELIRHVKKLAEECRIQMRHFRDEENKKVQKALDSHEIAEDQKFKLKKEIQEETDKVNEEIEKILENKIKEINL